MCVCVAAFIPRGNFPYDIEGRTPLYRPCLHALTTDALNQGKCSIQARVMEKISLIHRKKVK